MKRNIRSIFLAASLASAALWFSGCAGSSREGWELGVGSYGTSAGIDDSYSGKTDLDLARMNWGLVCFGNESASKRTADRLNRFLAINPQQKYVIRLWPGYSWKRPGEKQSFKVTFMDYLFQPSVRKNMQANIRQQIHVILDNISNPDAVYGFTFQEELPFHFSDGGADFINPQVLPRDMQYYRKQYEQENGRKLVCWDLDARKWWGGKFKDALNDIHACMRREIGNRKIFLWMAAHYRFLDWVEPGEDLHQWRVIPFYWKDFIHENGADGFFAYGNNKFWTEKYLKLARENNWPFFSQLSQHSEMRLGSFEECQRMVSTPVPQNKGYFLFITGNDAQKHWNDDPAIPADDNYSRFSIVSHTRRYCADNQINNQLVLQQLQPKVELDYNFEKDFKGRFQMVDAIVTNPRTPDWFLPEDQCRMKNLDVELVLPEGYEAVLANSAPARIKFPVLDGGDFRIIRWWIRQNGDRPASAPHVEIRLKHDGMDGVQTFKWDAYQSRIANPEAFYAANDGDSFRYVNYRMPWYTDQAEVTLECLYRNVSVPGISCYSTKTYWQGLLKPKDKLVFGPGMKATLYRHGEKAPRDVTDQLYGTALKWKRGLNNITFSCNDQRTGGGNVKITVKMPEQK